MRIQFDLTDIRRRAIADAVSGVLNLPLRYLGMPTANYEVDGYIITRHGELLGDGSIHSPTNSRLLGQLAELGYIGTVIDAGEDVPTKPPNSHILTVELPLAGFTPEALERLAKIVASKESVIRKSLAADTLPIRAVEDRLCFPWFAPPVDEAEVDAYTRFVTALCDMAKRQKRVVAREREVINEKFTMRVFLIRLGFIGTEYWAARRILLRNLTGNSAWKYGRPLQTNTEVGNMASVGEAAPFEDK